MFLLRLGANGRLRLRPGYLLAAETAPTDAAAALLFTPDEADQGGATSSIPEPAASSKPERRQITLLFCGLAAEVPAQLDPEDLDEIMTAYQCAVRTVVEQHRGTIVGYPGDWISVCFGWPAAQEDDAERAVRAALAVTKRIAALAPVPLEAGALRARVGIATGEAVVLHRSTSGAPEGRVAGGLPSLAAALQAAAGPDCVVVDAATHELTGRLFECNGISEVVSNGLYGPGDGFLVLCER